MQTVQPSFCHCGDLSVCHQGILVRVCVFASENLTDWFLASPIAFPVSFSCLQDDWLTRKDDFPLNSNRCPLFDPDFTVT